MSAHPAGTSPPVTTRPPGSPCRRLMFTSPGQVEILAEQLPPPGPGEVYARTVVSGISHGTEMAWLRGEAAALHRNWDPASRVYRDGQGRDYPVAPGYEIVAEIADLGPEVSGLAVGDLIYLDRPHADGHLVDAATARALATSTFQLPVHPGLSPAQLQWIAGTVASIANPESETSA